jgi:hypothetical protein
MSDGHYCIVRDLGPVKGGKGMKHHEVVVDFNRRGVAKLANRLFAALKDRLHDGRDIERAGPPEAQIPVMAKHTV